MKTKTIKAIIAKKVNEWLSSIEDEDLRTFLKNKIIVTGGCIASMLLKEKVNDFDVYLTNVEAAYRLADYYVKRFDVKQRNGIPVKIYLANEFGSELTECPSDGRVKIVVKSAGVASDEGADKPYEYFEMTSDENGADYVAEVMNRSEVIDDEEDILEAIQEGGTEDEGKKRFRPVFLSTNAITLSDKVQIILRFYGEPTEIHANYDFVHCTNYWYKGDLVLNQAALEALLARELRYIGSKYPICSIIRMRKFIKRGWQVNAGQILKMIMQVNELDLTDVKVLEDQLTGVDVAYFLQLIDRLKENNPEKVNSAYLVEIIDRMF